MAAWMGLARRYRRTPAELPALLAGWQAELRQLDAAADLEGLERAAATAEEASQQRMKEEAKANGEPEPQFETVSLRMRIAPFIEMMQRCQQAGVEIVWGV